MMSIRWISIMTFAVASFSVACGGAETPASGGESTSAATAGECLTKAKAAGPVGSPAWRDALTSCLARDAGAGTPTPTPTPTSPVPQPAPGGGNASCSYATQSTDGVVTCSGGPNDGAECTDESDCKARCSYDANGATGCTH